MRLSALSRLFVSCSSILGVARRVQLSPARPAVENAGNETVLHSSQQSSSQIEARASAVGESLQEAYAPGADHHPKVYAEELPCPWKSGLHISKHLQAKRYRFYRVHGRDQSQFGNRNYASDLGQLNYLFGDFKHFLEFDDTTLIGMYDIDVVTDSWRSAAHGSFFGTYQAYTAYYFGSASWPGYTNDRSGFSTGGWYSFPSSSECGRHGRIFGNTFGLFDHDFCTWQIVRQKLIRFGCFHNRVMSLRSSNPDFADCFGAREHAKLYIKNKCRNHGKYAHVVKMLMQAFLPEELGGCPAMTMPKKPPKPRPDPQDERTNKSREDVRADAAALTDAKQKGQQYVALMTELRSVLKAWKEGKLEASTARWQAAQLMQEITSIGGVDMRFMDSLLTKAELDRGTRVAMKKDYADLIAVGGT